MITDIKGKLGFSVFEMEKINEQLETGVSEKYEINSDEYLSNQYVDIYYAHGEAGDQVRVYMRHEWSVQ